MLYRCWGVGFETHVCVQADLEAIRGALLRQQGAYVNLTADEHTLHSVQPLLGSFFDALPAGPLSRPNWSGTLPGLNEAITVPTQVCTPAAPLGSALCEMLGDLFVWEGGVTASGGLPGVGANWVAGLIRR
jgi:hypothetical protein